MTGFTADFFSSGTGMLQKQGAHGRLGEPIVHLRVTGLAEFHTCIPFLDLLGLFALFFGRGCGETEKEDQY